MKRKEYSAGAVKMSFWFIEFRKVVQLLHDGKTIEEIKTLAQNENIFAAPTALRSNQIYSTVAGRIRSLDQSFIPFFLSGDLATQKLYALIAAMAYDTLFFDFVYEVIREKMIVGSNELTDSDVRVFFKDKQQQNEKVAGWTVATLVRLGRCYKTMLYEAVVIDKSKTARTILKPIFDPELSRWLEQNDMAIYEKALTGKIMDLTERLDAMEAAIRKPSFRQSSGKANEVNYWIFDYPPEKELEVRERIEYMKNKNQKGTDEYQLVVFDLYDIIIDFLERKNFIDKCYDFEKQRGFGRIVKAVSNSMKVSENDSLVVQYIQEHTPENAIVFLTGVGKCYPLLRSHNVLNNLHQSYLRAPVVMFFPGTYNEQELILFNEIKDDNYYRAFRLVK